MVDAVNDGGDSAATDLSSQPRPVCTDAVLLVQTAVVGSPVVDSASAITAATATTTEGADVEMAPSPAEAPVEPPLTLQERNERVESVRAPKETASPLRAEEITPPSCVNPANDESADALEPKATLETTKNWVEAIPTILHSFQKKESDIIDGDTGDSAMCALSKETRWRAPATRGPEMPREELHPARCPGLLEMLRHIPHDPRAASASPDSVLKLSAVPAGARRVLLRRVRSELLHRVLRRDPQHPESAASQKVRHGRAGAQIPRIVRCITTITEMIAANAASATTKTLNPSATDASGTAQATAEESGDQSGVGEKRKRDLSNVEVILLDSDSEDDGRNKIKRQTGVAVDVGNGSGFISRDRILRAQLSAMEQSQIAARSNQGVWPAQRSAYPQATAGAHPSSEQSSLVTANPNLVRQQNQFQQPSTTAIEPIGTPAPSVSPQAALSSGMQQFGIQQIVSSNAYDTSNISADIVNEPGSVNESYGISPVVVQQPSMPYVPPTQPPTPVGMQANGAYAGAPNVPIGNGTNGFAAGNSSPYVPQIPVSGVPAPTAGYSTTLTSVIPMPTDWNANPLEGVFYDRYQEINVCTVKLEHSVTTLNAHIVQLSTQNLQAAQQSMATLKQQQKMLQVVQSNRTAALVALIVQSSSIMQKVKGLRMDSLSDIPQVATASHRKCMKLSEQITATNTNAATLQQQMAITLETASMMSPTAFHQSVLQINQALQVTTQSIRRWKEDRENEIVRIVQYTAVVREELKRAFHHNAAAPSSRYPQQNHPNPNGSEGFAYDHVPRASLELLDLLLDLLRDLGELVLLALVECLERICGAVEDELLELLGRVVVHDSQCADRDVVLLLRFRHGSDFAKDMVINSALMESSDRGDKWLLEHLVQQTVRSVLFQDPQRSLAVADKPSLPPSPESVDAMSKTATLPVLLQPQEDAIDKSDFPPTEWFKRVLSCPEWTDDQLSNEKSAMKAFLREQEQLSDGNNERSAALHQSYEAYPLLKLFQSERKFNVSNDKFKPSPRFLQLLHVQLLVYAKCVERSNQRAFLTEDDIRPVRKLYDYFRQSRS
ncbi:hypothetical protein FI667_g13031, partial [Globisporangium splendens]